MRFSAVLGMYYFAYFAYVGAYSPYITLYFKELGMTAAQIGLLYSIPQVMRIFGPSAWGHLADVSGRPQVILRVAAVCSLIAFAGMYWNGGGAGTWSVFWGGAAGSVTPAGVIGTARVAGAGAAAGAGASGVLPAVSFAWLFAVLVAVHFFTSAQMPLVEAITLDHVRERPGDYGRIRVWGSVGFIAAVLGLGYLLDVLPVQWVIHVTVALLALVALVSFLIPAPVKHVHEGAAVSLRRQLMTRPVQVFLAASMLNAFAHAALYTFFSIYLAQLGYSKSVIGWMWSIGVLIEVGVFQCMPQLMRRFSLETLFFSTFIACALRFVLIAWTAQWWWALVFAQLLHAFTFAIYHASAVGLARQHFGAANQARGQAIYISVSFGLGGFAGAMASGLLWDWIGPSWTYTLSAAAGLLGAMLLWPGQRRAAAGR